MLLKIGNILKRIIINSFLIYTFNVIAVNFNLNIPFNIWTMTYVGLFDIPGLITLTILLIIGVWTWLKTLQINFMN